MTGEREKQSDKDSESEKDGDREDGAQRERARKTETERMREIGIKVGPLGPRAQCHNRAAALHPSQAKVGGAPTIAAGSKACGCPTFSSVVAIHTSPWLLMCDCVAFLRKRACFPRKSFFEELAITAD